MDAKELIKQAKEYEKQGNKDKAYIYYLEAALAEDDGEAVYRLAQMYLDGEYVNEDFEKSAHYFEVAYDRGYDLPSWLFVFIGGSYESGNEYCPKNPKTAMKWYKMAADRGVDYAYACIGELYYEGKGVKQNLDKAYELFVKSGEKETMPLYYLGLMHELGQVVAQDTGKAKEYYRTIVNEHQMAGEHGDLHYELAGKRLAKLE